MSTGQGEEKKAKLAMLRKHAELLKHMRLLAHLKSLKAAGSSSALPGDRFFCFFCGEISRAL